MKFAQTCQCSCFGIDGSQTRRVRSIVSRRSRKGVNRRTSISTAVSSLKGLVFSISASTAAICRSSAFRNARPAMVRGLRGAPFFFGAMGMPPPADRYCSRRRANASHAPTSGQGPRFAACRNHPATSAAPMGGDDPSDRSPIGQERRPNPNRQHIAIASAPRKRIRGERSLATPFATPDFSLHVVVLLER
jgi:hypothetical protein